MKNFIIFLILLLPPYLYGQKIGVNTTSPQTTLDVNGSFAMREGTPLSIVGLTGNDLSIGTHSVYRIIDAVSNFSITGIAGGQDGRILMLINGTSFNMSIGHQDVTSLLINRIVTNTNTNVVLLPNGIITLLYSNNSQRWLVTSIAGAIDNAYNAWDLTGNSNTSSATNFIGTTNAQDLVFRTNNTEGVRLSSAGNLGVGSTNPSNKLTVTGNASVSNHLAVGANSAINDGTLIQSGSTFNNVISVQEEMTGNQSTNYAEGILSHLSINATNNPTTEFYALDAIAEVKSGNARNYTSVVGNYHAANHRGTGTVSRLYGISSYTQNKSSGTVSDLRGLHLYPANNSTGSVTNAYGIFTKGINNIGAGTVTNAYGVFIDASCNTGGGILTNNYGLYVEDQSTAGTSHFNLYSKGLSSKNYFEGYVGIGTSTPTRRLTVSRSASSSDNDDDIQIQSYGTYRGPAFLMTSGRGTEASPSNLANGDTLGGVYFKGYVNNADRSLGAITNIYTGDGTTSRSMMAFNTSGSGTANEKMRILPDGEVGIGTTSPQAALHVASNNGGLYNDMIIAGHSDIDDMPVINIRRSRGTMSSPTNLTNGSSIGGIHYYAYVNSGWNYLSAVNSYYRGNGTTNLSNLIFQTSNSERMVIDENGSVGIGCTAPQYNLHVIGTIGASTSIRSPSTTTGAVLACSDIRYKKNIHPLSNALEKVMKIQGVTYDWRVNEFPDWKFSEKKQIGVIAQDIEKIYPELVETDEKGYKSVDYSKITPILVEAVKELKKEKDALKKELEELKTTVKKQGVLNENLLQRLEKIEASISKLGEATNNGTQISNQ